MRIARLRLRDFRSYSAADVRVGAGVTVVHGRNGAGKTNLLEALYVGCTGASWRTASDRELVRFGADVGRVELDAEAEDGAHAFSVGLEPGKRKRLRADGVAVDRPPHVAARPPPAVFPPPPPPPFEGGPPPRPARAGPGPGPPRPGRPRAPRGSPRPRRRWPTWPPASPRLPRSWDWTAARS